MSKVSKRRKTSDAVEMLHHSIKDDPEAQRLLDEARFNSRIAQIIYDARNDSGLTQNELAKLVGTTQSVIARLEDSDYEGRSLTMLNRIASALHRRLDVRLLPEPNRKAA
jgi:ribosome-binding protein aMBF1 (putative translation factor)